MFDHCLQLQPEPSGTAHSTWAKYNWKTEHWMPLYRHLDDTACVAFHLWDSWLAENARNLIIQDCGGDTLLAKKLAIFIAAGHDIGKHSSAFAMQVTPLKEIMITNGAEFLLLSPEERRTVPHAVVSALSLIDWFDEAIGAETKGRGYDCFLALATVVAAHHGKFPFLGDEITKSTYEREKNAFPQWHEERMYWWERAIATAGITDEDLEALLDLRFAQTTLLVLCGFLIMCDWIASNETLFPLTDYAPSNERAQKALNTLQLPDQWAPAPPSDDGELFSSRFRLPETAQPRPVQRAAMELARNVTKPCLMLIEAPTGEGKTEAALAATEILAERFGQNGVTVALPTCATSDGIFPRIVSWLETTLPPGSNTSAILTHGRAHFNEHYVELFSPKRVENIYDNDEQRPSSIHAHWWLRGRKTSALANFCVGTIDQVLFAALSSRHLQLRHVGLSGKVVIFDEIHASDHYMMVYLKRVLNWLGAMQVPVIALSATLDPARRAELLAEYKKGAFKVSNSKYSRKQQKADKQEAQNVTGYPVISIASAEEFQFITLEPSSRTSNYSIEFLPGDTAAIASFITETANEGGCIGVICNTVQRAQEVHKILTSEFDSEDIFLLHSRFIATERRKIERQIVDKLGPDYAKRPKRCVVVATQVIEQSLDIDFDLMYTDITPIDLIIQRAGRLQRHAQHHSLRLPKFSQPRLIIGGVEFAGTGAPTFDAGCEAVYGKAKLLRSVATLLNHINAHKNTIQSPTDIAPLVRMAYDAGLAAPAGWEEVWTTAEQEQEQLDTQLERNADTYCILPPSKGDLSNFDKATAGEAVERGGKAQVRDAEDSLEVIVVQQIHGAIHSLPFLEKYPSTQLDMTAGIDEDLARAVSMCTVSLPAFLSKGSLGDKIIAELEKNGLDSWQQSHWLKGQLPLVLDSELQAELAGILIRYDETLGLQVIPPERKP